jgi:hypothetical protein
MLRIHKPQLLYKIYEANIHTFNHLYNHFLKIYQDVSGQTGKQALVYVANILALSPLFIL